MPADLGRFNRTLVYSRRAPIDALLDDLAEVRAFDDKQEKINTAWTIAGTVGLLGAVAAVFLANSANASLGWPAWYAIIGIFVALTVVGFGTRWARSSQNLENRRYELAERILRFLRRDSRPSAEVSLQLDLRRPNVKKKKVSTGKVGPWKVTYYADPWLRVQGGLLDGTSYRLSAIEKHQHRRKSYRSRSGKWKSKSKTKSQTELIVGVRVKSRRYPKLSKLAVKNATQTLQLPEWVTLKACQIDAPANSDRGTLTLKSATTQEWSCKQTNGETEEPTSGVRWFAMSILSLYQVLNLARVSGKA